MSDQPNIQNGGYDRGEPIRFFMPGEVLILVEHEEREITSLKPMLQYVEGTPLERLIRNNDLPALQEEGIVDVVTFGRAEETNFSGVFFRGISADSDAQLVRLIVALNERMNDPGADTFFNPVSTSPNWFTRGSYSTGSGWGGPGGEPVPVPGAPGNEVRVPQRIQAAHNRLQSQEYLQGVDVAILDTVPSEYALREAYEKFGEAHRIIRTLLDDVSFTLPHGLPKHQLNIGYANDPQFQELNDLAANKQIEGYDYRMDDHGLFVAGVVHERAPEANIFLIQVLNDWGIGNIFTILKGMERLAAMRRMMKIDARERGEELNPLVINLSLMVDLYNDSGYEYKPPFDSDKWQTLLAIDDFLILIERMMLPLQFVCNECRHAGDGDPAIIVAAAGNDGLNQKLVNGERPNARYPAALDGVIGVGALHHDGSIAPYANIADTPSMDGFATYGGNIESTIPPGKQDDIADANYGMLGVYIGEFPDGDPNTNGWARWAGSSFATPNIAGWIAWLMSQGAADPLQVLRDNQNMTGFGEYKVM